jgi:hypothetical protein
MDPRFTTPLLADQFLAEHAADITRHGWTGFEIECVIGDYLARVAAPLNSPAATAAEKRTAVRLCSARVLGSLMAEVRRRGRLLAAQEILNRDGQ